jgi:hypothetical protein
MKDWNHDGKIDGRDFYLQDVAMEQSHTKTSAKKTSYCDTKGSESAKASQNWRTPYKQDNRLDFFYSRQYCDRYKNPAKNNILIQKLQTMFTFELITDPNVTWKDLDMNFEKGLVTGDRQVKKAQEYAELIADILFQLQQIPEQEAKQIEQEIYRNTLLQIYNLCANGVRMLYDMRALTEFFEQGISVVRSGQLPFETFCTAFKSADGAYEIVAVLLIYSGVEIKKALDINVIMDDNWYRKQLLKICNKCSEFAKVLYQRQRKVSLYPTYNQIESIWKFYDSFLDGLDATEIDGIHESEWTDVLSDKKQYTMENRKNFALLQKAAHDRVKKQIEDRAFWRGHPAEDQKRKIVNCEVLLLKIKTERLEKSTTLDSENSERILKQQEELKDKIKENNIQADRLNKRFFFRNKADQQAAELRYEAKKSEEKLSELNEKYKELQLQIKERNVRQQALNDRIQELCKQMG